MRGSVIVDEHVTACTARYILSTPNLQLLSGQDTAIKLFGLGKGSSAELVAPLVTPVLEFNDSDVSKSTTEEDKKAKAGEVDASKTPFQKSMTTIFVVTGAILGVVGLDTALPFPPYMSNFETKVKLQLHAAPNFERS